MTPIPDEPEPARLTVAGVRRETEVLLAMAAALEPFSRSKQLVILECVCTLLGEDEFARLFREARRG